ncbi:alpha subunit of ribonucleoside-diphosphate reductase [Coprinopsis marcescibilis]|uniref:Ribonucleoside-diphosphate reductase n=1 Tax=Coprinopsis marcescibilis TaxID=230819 RepID=A0A5C3KF35_COPMA|nr:alpha subunit of ribonucleoside-diphosphate reductase [Coprinopsis marcescibilis]
MFNSGANAQRRWSVAADIAWQMTVEDPSLLEVAAELELRRVYKATPEVFSSSVLLSHQRRLLSDEFMMFVESNRYNLNKAVNDANDIRYKYPALKALGYNYLLSVEGKPLERPQHMLMRCATQIHMPSVRDTIDAYERMARGDYIYASPTLFNSGSIDAQLCSCYLLSTADNPDTIFDTLSSVADISRKGGGVGLGIHNIPSSGSHGMERSGLVPIMKLFDAAMAVVDQGDKKRPGACAMYLEPWHADVEAFLDLKRIRGSEELRARNLFYAVWLSDLFMKRVRDNEPWTLFSPTDVPRLYDLYGDDFDREYIKLELGPLATRRVPARKIWEHIVQSQIETGGPFVMFKDAVNRKSNQKHVGTITHSNLCTEILQHSNDNEVATCTLASVLLPAFKNPMLAEFDFERLNETTRHLVRGLNRIIDCNTYPFGSARRCAQETRSIGIGVQGLADLLIEMGIPFDSDVSCDLSTKIAETMYYAAVDESCNLVSTLGTYPRFVGSPSSKGLFQFDLWNAKPATDRYDWEALRGKMKRGMSNSLLIAYMPTAGTTQITGLTESVEPLPGLVYNRKVLWGDYPQVNMSLYSSLKALNLWNDNMRNRIIRDKGSIQNIKEIPDRIRSLYKTAWDMPPDVLIRMAASRGRFICQSQSLSLFFNSPSADSLSKSLFTGWYSGLKTGLYYLRIRPASDPIPVTIPYANQSSSLAAYLRDSTEDTEQRGIGFDIGRGACSSCSG